MKNVDRRRQIEAMSDQEQCAIRANPSECNVRTVVVCTYEACHINKAIHVKLRTPKMGCESGIREVRASIPRLMGKSILITEMENL